MKDGTSASRSSFRKTIDDLTSLPDLITSYSLDPRRKSEHTQRLSRFPDQLANIRDVQEETNCELDMDSMTSTAY